MTAKKKIQLPWANEDIKAQVIRESKTVKFWLLAQAWNGRSNEGLTVQRAIKDAQDIMEDLNPERLVVARAKSLLDDIVTYGSKSKKTRALKGSNTNLPPPKTIIM